MKLPIKITRGHRWGITGYKSIYQRGAIVVTHTKTTPRSGAVSMNAEAVKLQVWLADWLYFMPALPETIWRHILCRLWLDRLTYQYEAGYSAGLHEGVTNKAAYDTLLPDELASLGPEFAADLANRVQEKAQRDDLVRAVMKAMREAAQ